MTILVILLIVLVVASIALFLLRKQLDKWYRTPLFVHNSIGGKFAVCSIVDYESACKSGEWIAGKVLVPETIVTCNDFMYDFHPTQKVNNLFVPFNSEGMMSFEQQKKFFVKTLDSGTYLTEKWRFMLLNDWRLRLAWWEKRRGMLEPSQYVSMSAVFLCCIILPGLSVISIQEASRAELVAVYMTSADEAAHRTIMKRGAPSTLLLPNIETTVPLIPGEVVRVEVLASGVTYSCLRPSGNKSTKDFCGFTSPTVKLGDKMVLRSEVVRMWAFNNHAREAGIVSNSPANLLITEQEAETLLVTGKFRIDNGPFH